MASVWCWSRFLLFLISSQIVVLAQAECYFPGGELATDQYPCDSSAATSLCCPSGWTCSPNSKCVFTDEEALGSTWPLASKGTCTDPEWDEAACGHFYLGNAAQDNASLEPCVDRESCRGSSAGSGKGRSPISDEQAETRVELRGLGSASTASSASSISISTTLTLSYLVSATSDPRTTITATTSPFAGSTPNPSTSGSTSTASAVSNAASVPVTHTVAFKAGIAVLVVVLIIAIIGAILFFIWRRKRSGGVRVYVKEELRVRESMFYRPPSLAPPEPPVAFMPPAKAFQPSLASSTTTLGGYLSENGNKNDVRYSALPPPNIRVDTNIRPYTGT